MNCLVANGFECNVYATYASPWDLFVRTDYSAYSTDDLFRDYGPKMYFKIEKDEEGKDQVSVITTRVADDGYNYYRYVDPLSAWYRSLILCAYNAESQSSFYTADFPVEISDDMNTVTIKTIEQDGQFYSPSVALEYTAGYPAWSYKTSTDGIVLTRATDDIQAMKTWTKSSSDTGKRVKVKPNDGNHFRRTRTPYDCDVKSPVEGSVLSAKSISAKYSKK